MLDVRTIAHTLLLYCTRAGMRAATAPIAPQTAAVTLGAKSVSVDAPAPSADH